MAFALFDHTHFHIRKQTWCSPAKLHRTPNHSLNINSNCNRNSIPLSRWANAKIGFTNRFRYVHIYVWFNWSISDGFIIVQSQCWHIDWVNRLMCVSLTTAKQESSSAVRHCVAVSNRLLLLLLFRAINKINSMSNRKCYCTSPK